MTDYVSAALRRLVRERAGRCCEYCRLPDDVPAASHELDHIIASKHVGETTADNLAWACFVCNRYKGSDLTSVDPQTGLFTRLFNPREDQWRSHFRYDDGRIFGLTAKGRTTARLLRFNLRENVEERRELHKEGRLRDG